MRVMVKLVEFVNVIRIIVYFNFAQVGKVYKEFYSEVKPRVSTQQSLAIHSQKLTMKET